MQFVYPGFLFALSAISIPILIHLFHFRRFRKIYFPNVAFLQQLSDESKKQSRLKHLLVLLARMLAIIFLVMAFARPFIPAPDSMVSHQGNLASVYIDNSFSMEALAGTGRLLDQAKGHARQIASIYQPGDRFLLLTNDFEGRHQRFVSHEEFLSLLDEIQESPVVRSVAEVMDRKNELMRQNQQTNRSMYFVSDFQKSTSGIEDIAANQEIPSYFIPVYSQNPGNIYIDTLWFESPVKILGQPVRMNVMIRNETDQDLENQPLRLYIDDVQRAVASWDAPAGGYAHTELTWTLNSAGVSQGRVEIIDYPVTFDDMLYFSFRTTSRIPVLAIDHRQPSPFLRALFGRDTTFVYSNMPSNAIDYSRFGQYSLIILNNLNSISSGLSRELQQFTRDGGSIIVFPGSDIDLDSYHDFMGALNMDRFSGIDTTSTRVTGLNELHEVFTGVFESLPDNIDLPSVNMHFPLQRETRSQGQFLLQMQNGNNFFTAYPYGQGNVFLSAVSLDDDFSNFQRHPLFVPIMVNVAMQSQAFAPLYYVLGSNQPVVQRAQPALRDEVYHLAGSDIEIIPEQRHTGNVTRLFFHDQLTQAGHYSLTIAEEHAHGLSFNYNRRESLLEAYTADELRNMLLDMGVENISIISTGESGFEQSLADFRLGQQLWKHFIALALLFLLIEVALLRLWR